MCLCLPALGQEIKTLGFYRMYYNGYRSSLFNPGRLCTRALNWKQGPHYSLTQYVGVKGDFLSFHWQVDLLGQVFQEKGYIGRDR